MSKQQVVREIHAPARKKFSRRKYVMYGIADTLQADLIEMQPYKRENRGHRYILIVIDVFSKMAYAEPLMNKTGSAVTQAMSSIIKKVHRQNPYHHINNLHTDEGTEFYNSTMKRLMDKFKINHYSTFSHMKASIVERLIRTIKRRLYMQFSMQGSYKWLEILPETIDRYNNTRHRTIRMTPNEVNSENELHLLDTVYKYKQLISTSALRRSAKFKVNDHVRLSKYKMLFDKSYTPNWTTEVFKIRKVQYHTEPITYLLSDYQNKEIKGAVYTEELQAVKHPNVYLFEKIIRRQNGRAYVKWLGFGPEHNSWVNERDIL